MTGWFIGLFFGWFVGLFIGWFFHWLVYCFTRWLVGWLVLLLFVDLFVGWLFKQLAGTNQSNQPMLCVQCHKGYHCGTNVLSILIYYPFIYLFVLFIFCCIYFYSFIYFIDPSNFLSEQCCVRWHTVRNTTAARGSQPCACVHYWNPSNSLQEAMPSPPQRCHILCCFIHLLSLSRDLSCSGGNSFSFFPQLNCCSHSSGSQWGSLNTSEGLSLSISL